ncbi:HET-domain-containing protein [Dendrothele bispora CBS 962.96]|uniref:HET-domain-containing protein n=1 Tax=Dendrothele bispora (strain CBS 962.96) TaxID=1314807 RepID=A0A4S8M070_DENBC|nr:HET-domain-containing protein [Dendrothele bispora CBS 962.96]
MRLLNTKTFLLQEFYTDVPPYAILSHTWGKREVTFQDMQNTDAIKTREDLQAGWSKVKKACEHAHNYSFEWIWIDSCCINKESSAELSEALNSMYQYYEDAEVCYVYLSDVSGKEDPRDPSSTFRVSRWFKRGWTLQELLAPSHVVFLDKNWADLGTRQSLRDAISAITLVPVEVFEGKDIAEFSIAQRMSWAAFRETTRPEDQAYSLMGIFGVNMPPIYGEGGPKAFMRLQQEIIKISDDRSIFARNCEVSWLDLLMSSERRVMSVCRQLFQTFNILYILLATMGCAYIFHLRPSQFLGMVP